MVYRQIEPAYLRAATPQAGSGFGGDARQWRERREPIVDVPVRRRLDLVRHVLDDLTEPGGRLLVSHYQSAGGTDLTAAQHLRRLGLPVRGESYSHSSDRAATTAWIDAQRDARRTENSPNAF